MAKAAYTIKKHKLLKPIIYIWLFISLGIYSVIKYFGSNGKKYITIGLCLVFFLMSSSFTTPSQKSDSEIYLSSKEVVSDSIDDEIINEGEADFEKEIELIMISEESSGYSSEVYSDDEDDRFSLDDYLEQYEFDDTSVVDDTNGFDKDAWNLILVNKTHPIPDGYEVPLANINKKMRCDERALEPLLKMLKAAQNDGIDLVVCSPYRDSETQQKLFDKQVKAYMTKYNYSYTQAYKLTSTDTIVPGTSEHQIGLAFDIVTSDHWTLNAAFADTPAGKWLKENCQDYGFILRYPLGKEDITGIEFEPWHFRYVGVEAATYIMEHELTLEEFIEELE